MASALIDLQRQRGNRFVQQVVQALRSPPLPPPLPGGRQAPPLVQAKLLVGSPNDRYEHEADRVASGVTAGSGSSAEATTAPSPERVAGHVAPVEAGTDRAVSAARGGGRHLPAPVRAPLERSLAADLGAVRVHTDATADRLSRDLGALAFTAGTDIFFRRGRYDPGTRAGRHLLAHELTHVVQQRGRPDPPLQRKVGFEYEIDSIRTRHSRSWSWSPYQRWIDHDAGELILPRTDYDLTADVGKGYSRLEFRTRAFDETKPEELAKLTLVVGSIVADIAAIKNASLTHPRKGYGAGNRWVFGGEQGWYGLDRWVGLDQIPRFKGTWRQQLEYAGRAQHAAEGQLQMTAGFDLMALQRLVSGEQLGNMRRWGQEARTDARQFLHEYARAGDVPSKLYSTALKAVRSSRLARGGREGSEGAVAAVLAVMAQPSISFRNHGYDFGQLLAKTDYARILSLVEEMGVQLDRGSLLTALLTVVQAHIPNAQVTADDPVIPANQQLDLGRSRSGSGSPTWSPTDPVAPGAGHRART